MDISFSELAQIQMNTFSFRKPINKDSFSILVSHSLFLSFIELPSSGFKLKLLLQLG